MTNIPYDSLLHLVREREKAFDELYRRGSFSPLLLQQALGAFVLLSIPLVVRHKNAFHSRLLRYGFHAVITVFCLYLIWDVRFLGPVNSYGVGLITSWYYIWSTTILICNDVQRGFKRVVKEDVRVKDDAEYRECGQNETSEALNGTIDQELRRRKGVMTSQQSSKPSNEIIRRMYQWQPFPHRLSERVEWVTDLIFNFRGPNWNWRIRTLPPLPESVIRDIGEQTIASKRKYATQTKLALDEPHMRLRSSLLSFLRDYVVLDFLKLLLMRDPYFWGFVDGPVPSPPWPFSILVWSPVLVRAYRISLSLLSVLFALDIIMSLNPLFFLGLSIAFPKFSRVVTHQPLGEAWLYPDSFGPALSALDGGLIGAWNTWWHQLFRFGFSECSRFITDLLLPDDRKKGKIPNNLAYPSLRTSARRMLQVLLAFSLSGFVHAMGSYTSSAESKPWNVFLFFFLQGVGIIVQSLFEAVVFPKLFPITPPRWLIRIANLVAIVLWFYFTGPLITDDLSRAGAWAYEPIPFSFLRRGEGNSWICWRGPWFGWHSSRIWWQSGIRLI